MTSKGGWIGVDLDGTIAHYDTWKGPTKIGKPIKPMIKWVKDRISEGREVRVFTARMTENDVKIRTAIEVAICNWTEKHIGVRLFATNVKDFGCRMIVDDIAVGVLKNTGKFDSLIYTTERK